MPNLLKGTILKNGGRYMTITKLIAGNSYGTKAKDIYLNCCNSFGWDKSKANEFGMMKPLYARGAADRGTKAVWFICKNNWYNDLLIPVNSNGKIIYKHRNYIYDNLQCIEEYQQDSKLYPSDYPLQDRIVFVKNKSGQYVFLGVYRAKEPNSDRHDRTFYRIGYDYTIN